MSVAEVTKMPKVSTLRKYYPYPDSKLSDERLVELAEWLRKYLGHQHISADNHILAALIAWEEANPTEEAYINSTGRIVPKNINMSSMLKKKILFKFVADAEITEAD